MVSVQGVTSIVHGAEHDRYMSRPSPVLNDPTRSRPFPSHRDIRAVRHALCTLVDQLNAHERKCTEAQLDHRPDKQLLLGS